MVCLLPFSFLLGKCLVLVSDFCLPILRPSGKLLTRAYLGFLLIAGKNLHLARDQLSSECSMSSDVLLLNTDHNDILVIKVSIVVDIQTVSIAIACASVVAGIIYYSFKFDINQSKADRFGH